ncbi:Glutathione S-transferase, C-terminal, partial [Dillenia turbinata]
ELQNELKDEQKKKKFFGGERISLVDIAANFKGYWLGVTQEALGVELGEAWPIGKPRLSPSITTQTSRLNTHRDPKIMANEEVKLLGAWGSAFSRRVEIALKLKGVKYEYIEEDIHNKSPLLLRSNPVHKKIPVLIHNGKPIAESQVIIEYIDETWDGYPILPKDPYQRAVARFWAKFLDEKCLPAVRKAWLSTEEKDKNVEEALEVLKIVENELKNKNFFGGNTINMVDIIANLIGYWFGVVQEAAGIELANAESFPALHNYMNEYVKCSHFKEHLPPREKLVEYYRARFEATSSSK